MNINRFLKLITWMVIVSFTANNISLAQSGVKTLAPVSQAFFSGLENTSQITNLSIPSGLGRISETYKGTNGKTIIHIIDTHADYSVQKNYAEILKNIISPHPCFARPLPNGERMGEGDEGRVLLAIEGAKGPIDTSLFRAIPDEEIKQKITDYFLKRGYLTGAEYFSIFAEDDNFIFWGVDDKELYLKNLGLFKKVQKIRDKVCLYIDKVKAGLDNDILTQDQARFIESIESYHSHKLSVTEYCMKLANDTRHKNISRLIKATEIDKRIDYESIEKERELLLEELKTRLVKEDLEELVQKSILLKAGRMDAKEYYVYLLSVIASPIKRGEAISEGLLRRNDGHYTNLYLYRNLMRLYSRVNHKELISEIGRLELELIEKMGEVVKAHYNLIILQNLVDLELTRDEWGYYKSIADFELPTHFRVSENRHCEEGVKQPTKQSPTRLLRSFRSLAMTNRIFGQSDLGGVSPLWGGRISDLRILEQYYTTVLQRDDVLMENTLQKMEEEHIDTAVLITGGFHTEGITEKLKEKGASYIVVSPKGSGCDYESPYLSVMLNKLSPFEMLITQYGTRLIPYIAMAVDSMGEMDAKNRGIIIQQMVPIILALLYVSQNKELIEGENRNELERKVKESMNDFLERYIELLPEDQKVTKRQELQENIDKIDIKYDQIQADGNNILVQLKDKIALIAANQESYQEQLKRIKDVTEKIDSLLMILMNEAQADQRGITIKLTKNLRYDVAQRIENNLTKLMPHFSDEINQMSSNGSREKMKLIRALQNAEGDLTALTQEQVDGAITTLGVDSLKNNFTNNPLDVLKGIRNCIREGHERYHTKGNFSKVIEQIAMELIEIGHTINLNNRGEYDLRELLQRTKGKKRTTQNGEIRLEKAEGIDTEILIIQDGRFIHNHASRRRFAIYAKTEKDVQRKLKEFKLWINYAKAEITPNLSEEEIKQGVLNNWISKNIKQAKELDKQFFNQAAGTPDETGFHAIEQLTQNDKDIIIAHPGGEGKYTITPEELGIPFDKLITPQEDPVAGFIYGGVNKIINGLTSIRGISIEELEYRMGGVFIDKDEKLLDILIRDNTFVIDRGFNHQKLAYPLYYAFILWKKRHLGKKMFEYVYEGTKYRMTTSQSRGKKSSPFNDGYSASTSHTIINLETGAHVHFSALLPPMIWDYGFYEGNTGYRVEPQDIIDTFFFNDDDIILKAKRGEHVKFTNYRDISRLSGLSLEDCRSIMPYISIEIRDIRTLLEYLKLLKYNHPQLKEILSSIIIMEFQDIVIQSHKEWDTFSSAWGMADKETRKNLFEKLREIHVSQDIDRRKPYFGDVCRVLGCRKGLEDKIVIEDDEGDVSYFLRRLAEGWENKNEPNFKKFVARIAKKHNLGQLLLELDQQPSQATFTPRTYFLSTEAILAKELVDAGYLSFDDNTGRITVAEVLKDKINEETGIISFEVEGKQYLIKCKVSLSTIELRLIASRDRAEEYGFLRGLDKTVSGPTVEYFVKDFLSDINFPSDPLASGISNLISRDSSIQWNPDSMKTAILSLTGTKGIFDHWLPEIARNVKFLTSLITVANFFSAQKSASFDTATITYMIPQTWKNFWNWTLKKLGVKDTERWGEAIWSAVPPVPVVALIGAGLYLFFGHLAMLVWVILGIFIAAGFLGASAWEETIYRLKPTLFQFLFDGICIGMLWVSINLFAPIHFLPVRFLLIFVITTMIFIYIHCFTLPYYFDYMDRFKADHIEERKKTAQIVNYAILITQKILLFGGFIAVLLNVPIPTIIFIYALGSVVIAPYGIHWVWNVGVVGIAEAVYAGSGILWFLGEVFKKENIVNKAKAGFEWVKGLLEKWLAMVDINSATEEELLGKITFNIDVFYEIAGRRYNHLTAEMETDHQPAGSVGDLGRCVTGDTILPIVSPSPVLRTPSPTPILSGCPGGEETLWKPSTPGYPRGAWVGEGRVRGKQIVDVNPGDYVLSLNEETSKIEPHRINGLLDMGIKPVYKLITATGRSIKTTANHPYLTKNGWIKVSGLKGGDEIGVPCINSVQNFSRSNIKQSYRDVVTSICGLTNLDSNGGGGAKSSISTSNMGWLGSCCDRAIPDIHLLNSGLSFSWKTTWALLGIFISGWLIIYLSNSHPNVLCISQNISLLTISYLLIKTFFINLPICIQINLGKGQRFIIIRNPQRNFFSLPVSMEDVFMRISMRSIISYDRIPFTFNFYFKLCRKFQDFAMQMGMAMSSTAIITIRNNKLSNFLHNPTISLSNNDDTIFPSSFRRDNSTITSNLSSIFTGSVAEASEIGPLTIFPLWQGRGVGVGDILWDRIISIDYIGYEHVYDIEVEGTHNFVGNGIFAHNTYIPELETGNPPEKRQHGFGVTSANRMRNLSISCFVIFLMPLLVNLLVIAIPPGLFYFSITGVFWFGWAIFKFLTLKNVLYSAMYNDISKNRKREIREKIKEGHPGLDADELQVRVSEEMEHLAQEERFMEHRSTRLTTTVSTKFYQAYLDLYNTNLYWLRLVISHDLSRWHILGLVWMFPVFDLVRQLVMDSRIKIAMDNLRSRAPRIPTLRKIVSQVKGINKIADTSLIEESYKVADRCCAEGGIDLRLMDRGMAVASEIVNLAKKLKWPGYEDDLSLLAGAALLYTVPEEHRRDVSPGINRMIEGLNRLLRVRYLRKYDYSQVEYFKMLIKEAEDEPRLVILLLAERLVSALAPQEGQEASMIQEVNDVLRHFFSNVYAVEPHKLLNVIDGLFEREAPEEFEKINEVLLKRIKMDVSSRETKDRAEILRERKKAYERAKRKLKQVALQLEKVLKNAGFSDIRVIFRVKGRFSLRDKLVFRKGDIDEVWDILGLCIVTESDDEIYKIKEYLLSPQRDKKLNKLIGRIAEKELGEKAVKDYIRGQIKKSGYRAIHLECVYGEKCRFSKGATLEVKIMPQRTFDIEGIDNLFYKEDSRRGREEEGASRPSVIFNKQTPGERLEEIITGLKIKDSKFVRVEINGRCQIVELPNGAAVKDLLKKLKIKKAGVQKVSILHNYRELREKVEDKYIPRNADLLVISPQGSSAKRAPLLMPWLKDSSDKIKVYFTGRHLVPGGVYDILIAPVLENWMMFGIFTGISRIMKIFLTSIFYSGGLGGIISAGLALSITSLLFSILHFERISGHVVFHNFWDRFITAHLVFSPFIIIFFMYSTPLGLSGVLALSVIIHSIINLNRRNIRYLRLIDSLPDIPRQELGEFRTEILPLYREKILPQMGRLKTFFPSHDEEEVIEFLCRINKAESLNKILSICLYQLFRKESKGQNYGLNLIEALIEIRELLGIILPIASDLGKEDNIRGILVLINNVLATAREPKGHTYSLNLEQWRRHYHINKSLVRLFKNVKKPELHHHLDGSISADLILKILCLYTDARGRFVKMILKEDGDINEIFLNMIGGPNSEQGWQRLQGILEPFRTGEISDREEFQRGFIGAFGGQMAYRDAINVIKHYLEYRPSESSTTGIVEFLEKFSPTNLALYFSPEAMRIVARESTLEEYYEDNAVLIEQKIHNLAMPFGYSLKDILENILKGLEDAGKKTGGALNSGLIVSIFKNPELVLMEEGENLGEVREEVSRDRRTIEEIKSDIFYRIRLMLETDYRLNKKLLRENIRQEKKELNEVIKELERMAEKRGIDKASFVKEQLLIIWEVRKAGIEQARRILKARDEIYQDNPELAKRLIGIDTVGSEIDYIYWTHSYALRLARYNGLKVSEHAGELWPEGDIFQALNRVRSAVESGAVSRIGHATCLGIHPDALRDDVWLNGDRKGEKLYSEDEIKEIVRLQWVICRLIKKKGIVIETNPTSNILLMSKYLKKYSLHPVRHFFKLFKQGLVVSSDDPSILHTIGLRGEFAKVWLSHPKFRFYEILQIIQNGFDNAYLKNYFQRRGVLGDILANTALESLIWEWLHRVSRFRVINEAKKLLVRFYRRRFGIGYDMKDKFIYTAEVKDRLIKLLESKKKKGYRFLLFGLPTCSGKTTWAGKLAEANPGQYVVIGMDRYFRSRDDRKDPATGLCDFDSPDAYDWEKLESDLLPIIINGNGSINGEYDFAYGAPREKNEDRVHINLSQGQSLIIEGIYALHPRMIEIFNRAEIELRKMDKKARLKVYKACLRASPLLRIVRRVIRDSTERYNSPLDTIINWFRSGGIRDMEKAHVLSTYRNAYIWVDTETKGELNELAGSFERACQSAIDELNGYTDEEFLSRYNMSKNEVREIIDILIGLVSKQRDFTDRGDTKAVFRLFRTRSGKVITRQGANPPSTIRDLRRFFAYAMNNKGFLRGAKAGQLAKDNPVEYTKTLSCVYETEIAPVLEEYGVWLGGRLLIGRIFKGNVWENGRWNEIKIEFAEANYKSLIHNVCRMQFSFRKIFFLIGYRTVIYLISLAAFLIMSTSTLLSGFELWMCYLVGVIVLVHILIGVDFVTAHKKGERQGAWFVQLAVMVLGFIFPPHMLHELINNIQIRRGKTTADIRGGDIGGRLRWLKEHPNRDILLDRLGKKYLYGTDVLCLRLGITEDGVPKTLEQIGKEFGITRERVRQIQEKALDLLGAEYPSGLSPRLNNLLPKIVDLPKFIDLIRYLNQAFQENQISGAKKQQILDLLGEVYPSTAEIFERVLARLETDKDLDLARQVEEIFQEIRNQFTGEELNELEDIKIDFVQKLIEGFLSESKDEKSFHDNSGNYKKSPETMPAWEILNVLGLLDIDAIGGEVRNGPQGSKIKRISTASPDFPEDCRFLGRELVKREDEAVIGLDLIFNQAGYLIAIFPVTNEEEIVSHGIRYFDLSPYYIEIPQIGDERFQSAWQGLARNMEGDHKVINEYKTRRFCPEVCARITAIAEERASYAYVEINKKDGKRNLFNFDPLGSERMPVEDDNYFQIILPIFPTVYYPVRKPDDIYYSNLSSRSLISEGSEVLICGPGAGLDAYVASRLTKQKICSFGINPLEIANLRATAKIGNFAVEAVVHDNLMDSAGRIAFPDKKFDRIFWNMPYFMPIIKRGDNLPENKKYSMQDYWDKDEGGKALIKFAKALPFCLKQDGIAMVCNEPFFMEDTTAGGMVDSVKVILEMAWDIDGKKVFDVVPYYDRDEERAVYYISFKKGKGDSPLFVKGSALAALDTIYKDRGLKGGDITTMKLYQLRTQYTKRTICEEIRILRELGILMPVKGKSYTYQLAGEVRNLSPPQFELLKDTLLALVPKINHWTMHYTKEREQARKKISQLFKALRTTKSVESTLKSAWFEIDFDDVEAFLIKQKPKVNIRRCWVDFSEEADIRQSLIEQRISNALRYIYEREFNSILHTGRLLPGYDIEFVDETPDTTRHFDLYPTHAFGYWARENDRRILKLHRACLSKDEILRFALRHMLHQEVLSRYSQSEEEVNREVLKSDRYFFLRLENERHEPLVELFKQPEFSSFIPWWQRRKLNALCGTIHGAVPKYDFPKIAQILGVFEQRSDYRFLRKEFTYLREVCAGPLRPFYQRDDKSRGVAIGLLLNILWARYEEVTKEAKTSKEINVKQEVSRRVRQDAGYLLGIVKKLEAIQQEDDAKGFGQKYDFYDYLFMLDGLLGKALTKPLARTPEGIKREEEWKDVLRSHVFETLKLINSHGDDPKYISFWKGILGELAGVYLSTFRFNDLQTSYVSRADSEHLRKIAKTHPVIGKEMDAITRGSRTIYEYKFRGWVTPLYRQIMGWHKERSVFGELLSASGGESDTEHLKATRNISHISDYDTRFEDSISRLALEFIYQKPDSQHKGMSLTERYTMSPYLGFSVRLSLTEFGEFLRSDKVLARMYPQVGNSREWEEKKQAIRRFIDLQVTGMTKYYSDDFDIYLAVRKPRQESIELEAELRKTYEEDGRLPEKNRGKGDDSIIPSEGERGPSRKAQTSGGIFTPKINLFPEQGMGGVVDDRQGKGDSSDANPSTAINKQGTVLKNESTLEIRTIENFFELLTILAAYEAKGWWAVLGTKGNEDASRRLQSIFDAVGPDTIDRLFEILRKRDRKPVRSRKTIVKWINEGLIAIEYHPDVRRYCYIPEPDNLNEIIRDQRKTDEAIARIKRIRAGAEKPPERIEHAPRSGKLESNPAVVGNLKILFDGIRTLRTRVIQLSQSRLSYHMLDNLLKKNSFYVGDYPLVVLALKGMGYEITLEGLKRNLIDTDKTMEMVKDINERILGVKLKKNISEKPNATRLLLAMHGIQIRISRRFGMVPNTVSRRVNNGQIPYVWWDVVIEMLGELDMEITKEELLRILKSREETDGLIRKIKKPCSKAKAESPERVTRADGQRDKIDRLKMEVSFAIESKDFQRALELCRRILKSEPNNPETLRLVSALSGAVRLPEKPPVILEPDANLLFNLPSVSLFENQKRQLIQAGVMVVDTEAQDEIRQMKRPVRAWLKYKDDFDPNVTAFLQRIIDNRIDANESFICVLDGETLVAIQRVEVRKIGNQTQILAAGTIVDPELIQQERYDTKTVLMALFSSVIRLRRQMTKAGKGGALFATAAHEGIEEKLKEFGVVKQRGLLVINDMAADRYLEFCERELICICGKDSGHLSSSEEAESSSGRHVGDLLPEFMDCEIIDILNQLIAEQRIIYEHQLYELMQNYFEIPVPAHVFVSRNETIAGGDIQNIKTEYVYIKVVSSRILHKKDAGGVRKVINNPDAINKAIHEMSESLGEIPVEGFIIVEEIDVSEEYILGFTTTDAFGHLLQIGKGGSGIEERGGTTFKFFPAKIEDIKDLTPIPQDLLSKFLRLFKVLQGCNFSADFECNPIAMTKDGRFLPLDARLLAREKAEEIKKVRSPVDTLSTLFSPMAVALVGATTKPGLNNLVTLNLVRYHDEGKIKFYPVSKNNSDIYGIQVPENVSAIKDKVDLVVISVSAPNVPAVISDVIAKAKEQETSISVILIAAGFGETEENGKRLEKELQDNLRTAKEQGVYVNLVGGNCMGAYMAGAYNAFFFDEKLLKIPYHEGKNKLAIVSQSGARIAIFHRKTQDLGVAASISIGNAADLKQADYLDYITEYRPDIPVVAFYLEGFAKDEGRRFYESVKGAAAAGKKIIVYAAGRSHAGSKATQSHTANMASDRRVVYSLLEEAGAICVDNPNEMETRCRQEIGKLVDLPEDGSTKEAQDQFNPQDFILSSNNVAIITESGCASVEIADFLDLKHLQFATLSEEQKRELKCPLASIANKSIPLDVTGQCSLDNYFECARIVLRGDCSALILSNTISPAWDHMEYVRKIIELKREFPNKLIIVTINAARYGPYRELFNTLIQAGIPTFDYPFKAALFCNQIPIAVAGPSALKHNGVRSKQEEIRFSDEELQAFVIRWDKKSTVQLEDGREARVVYASDNEMKRLPSHHFVCPESLRGALDTESVKDDEAISSGLSAITEVVYIVINQEKSGEIQAEAIFHGIIDGGRGTAENIVRIKSGNKVVIHCYESPKKYTAHTGLMEWVFFRNTANLGLVGVVDNHYGELETVVRAIEAGDIERTGNTLVVADGHWDAGSIVDDIREFSLKEVMRYIGHIRTDPDASFEANGSGIFQLVKHNIVSRIVRIDKHEYKKEAVSETRALVRNPETGKEEFLNKAWPLYEKAISEGWKEVREVEVVTVGITKLHTVVGGTPKNKLIASIDWDWADGSEVTLKELDEDSRKAVMRVVGMRIRILTHALLRKGIQFGCTTLATSPGYIGQDVSIEASKGLLRGALEHNLNRLDYLSRRENSRAVIKLLSTQDIFNEVRAVLPAEGDRDREDYARRIIAQKPRGVLSKLIFGHEKPAEYIDALINGLTKSGLKEEEQRIVRNYLSYLNDNMEERRRINEVTGAEILNLIEGAVWLDYNNLFDGEGNFKKGIEYVLKQLKDESIKNKRPLHIFVKYENQQIKEQHKSLISGFVRQDEINDLKASKNITETQALLELAQGINGGIEYVYNFGEIDEDKKGLLIKALNEISQYGRLRRQTLAQLVSLSLFTKLDRIPELESIADTDIRHERESAVKT